MISRIRPCTDYRTLLPFEPMANKGSSVFWSSRVRAISICLTILSSLVVTSCKPDPPPWKYYIDDAVAVPAPAPTPVTSNHLVVYLDTSGSMAGYVSADRQGQTVFSHSLQELRNFISIINPPLDVVVRRVDSTISAPYPDSYLSEASVDPGVFNGKDTDLAGAISSFEKSVGATIDAAHGKSVKVKETNDENADEPLPPARFHVLVTDGVQSQSKQSADASCLAGSDQACVRKRILALLGKGWGGHVIGVRSEFQGKVYSEVARSSAIAYQSKKRDPQSLRPFYIYLFSPDRVALDKLVTALTSRLRPLLAGEQGMRSLALTAGYSDGAAQADVTIPKESSRVLTLSKSGRHENPPGFTLHVEPGTDKSGPVPFQIAIIPRWAANVRDQGSPKELGEMITWRLVPLKIEEEAKKTGRYPELKITSQKVEADGRISIEATAQFPADKTGDHWWRGYCLEGDLNLEEQIPPWIRQWSTNVDNTVETGNKTFNLESSLLGLWNKSVQKQPVAQIYFRVGP